MTACLQGIPDVSMSGKESRKRLEASCPARDLEDKIIRIETTCLKL